MTWRRTAGSRKPIDVRFFEKVIPGFDGCWQWIGATNQRGYGHIRTGGDGALVAAHRWSWEFFRGEIPVGLEVDHLCFNRSCVNPDHLDVVTRLVNVNRGRTNQNAGARHCKQGHAFDEANTRTDPKTGKRACRTCGREVMRRIRAERRNAA